MGINSILDTDKERRGATDFPQIAFGASVNDAQIVDDMMFFDDWEDRYRYVIELGRMLPPMPAVNKIPANLVRGCQSQVWLLSRWNEEKSCLEFFIESDAFIVQGLIAIVLAALNYRTPEQILGFDMEAYLKKLNLLEHLSMTRGNGMRSMIHHIRSIAARYLQSPVRSA